MEVAPTPLVTLGPLTIPRRRLMALTAAGIVLFVVLFVAAPAAAPGVLVACLVPPILWCRADKRSLSLTGTLGGGAIWIWLAPACFAAWMLLSTSWSPDARTGMAAAIRCLAALAIVFTVATLAPRVSADVRAAMARALVVGVALSIVMLIWEALTDMSLRRLVMNLVPPLRPMSPDVEIEDGRIVALPFYFIKKNAAVLMMLFWPALLAAVHHAARSATKRALVPAVALFVVAISIAGHDSSRVALVVSGAVFVLAVRKPDLALRLVATGWLVATLAAVPLALAAYKADLHKSSFIQFSGRHRVVIWERTVEQVFKAPIRGAGLSATRYLDEAAGNGGARPYFPGTDIPDGTNIHAHNAFLQTWHELGAVGALLLAAAGWPMLSWIQRQRVADRPYLLATLATAATIASLSWSLTAAWLIATYAIVAITAQFAALASEDVAAEAMRG